jgi:hypothetical protein
MTGVLAARTRLALLILALGLLLGAPCDGGGGQQKTRVKLVPSATTVGTYSALVVEIQVSSPTPIQAFELGLHWDPQMLNAVAVFPHSEFSDDGAFFINPHWNHPAGRLERVVDLKHGGTGATGTFKVATLWFTSRGSTGSTSLQPTSGGLADGSGNEPQVTVTPLTITIAP